MADVESRVTLVQDLEQGGGRGEFVRASQIDGVAVSIGSKKIHPTRKPLFSSNRHAVITGPAAIISEKKPAEVRIRHTLLDGNEACRIRRGNVLVTPLRKLLAHVSDIPHVQQPVFGEIVLQIKRPLLHVRRAVPLINAEGI